MKLVVALKIIKKRALNVRIYAIPYDITSDKYDYTCISTISGSRYQFQIFSYNGLLNKLC